MTIPRSLRARLTLFFTAVTAAAVVAAAVGADRLTEHTVWAWVDAALEEEAETLAVLARVDDGDLPDAVRTIQHESDLGPDKFVRVIGAGGRTLARAGTVPPVVAAAAVDARGTRFATVWEGNRPFRVARYAMPGGGVAELGVRATAQMRTLWRTRFAIGASGIALLVILAVVAFTVTSRATAELGRLAAELEAIEAGSLDHRLAARRTSEVDRLVEVLNRLLSRLEGAMVHLRRFTADAAHELRTPIAALRARLEVALARDHSASEYRDGLLDALEQTERLGRLAEDLLTLSAVESGLGAAANGGQLVRLDAVAREVAEFLEPVAQEQHRAFRWDAAGPVVVRGAPDLLRRVLLNLVDNAFRHTPPTAAVEFRVRATDGHAQLEVSDRGAGIPTGDMPHAFERFRRAGATGGAGLGLALCREIVARHGGHIALRSDPGAGTVVTVTLPLAAAGEASGAPPAARG